MALREVGPSSKTYLGDGAYAEFDEGGNLHLTTSNGIAVTNRVVCEPEILAALLRYLEAQGLITWRPMA